MARLGQRWSRSSRIVFAGWHRVTKEWYASTMKIVSIDPAPSKDAVVFDGQLQSIPASQVPAFCWNLSQQPDTLLCWDAPLTGPAMSVAPAGQVGSFAQRQIEQFFSRKETGFKTPAGISVLPYSGCPHWAITRASLGLPICGRFDWDTNELPFRLATSAAEISPGAARVVETHPAVAIWLWCKNLDDDDRPWVYKGRKSSRTILEIWNTLSRIWSQTQVQQVLNMIDAIEPPANDDQLDAIVGWVLGMLLVGRHPSVGILGTRATGAIALPIDHQLQTSFNRFLQENPM